MKKKAEEVIGSTHYLMVGTNKEGEVVVNLDQDYTGHIIFSPQEARHLALVLRKQAKIAEMLRIKEGR